MIETEKEKANLNNYSASTTTAILEVFMASFGEKKAEFDPRKYLPCLTDSQKETIEEAEEQLDITSKEAIRLLLHEIETKQLPIWVLKALAPNLSRWRNLLS